MQYIIKLTVHLHKNNNFYFNLNISISRYVFMNSVMLSLKKNVYYMYII
jgi:hypothetical protein